MHEQQKNVMLENIIQWPNPAHAAPVLPSPVRNGAKRSAVTPAFVMD